MNSIELPPSGTLSMTFKSLNLDVNAFGEVVAISLAPGFS
jgi:hypothetical protein